MCLQGDWRYADDVLSIVAPVQHTMVAGVVFLFLSVVEEKGG